MRGRQVAMNPTHWLPHAMAAASASSRRPRSRHLSRCTSALITALLATSPAAAPPTPSATAARRGLANTASSLSARMRPTSLRTAYCRLRPATAGTVATRPSVREQVRVHGDEAVDVVHVAVELRDD